MLVAADSGNGVSSPLDYREWMFINADVSVTLRRLPAGEWVGLEAATYPETDGVGMSDTILRDERGMLGRSTQTCSSIAAAVGVQPRLLEVEVALDRAPDLVGDRALVAQLAQAGALGQDHLAHEAAVSVGALLVVLGRRRHRRRGRGPGTGNGGCR